MGKSDRTETNRRNAAKSTGPKTELGKARSALNRASHGLRSEVQVIPGESAEDFRAFVAGIALELKAEGEAESAAANLIASCLWRLGRVARFEAATVSRAMSRGKVLHEQSMDLWMNSAEEVVSGAVTSVERIGRIRGGLWKTEDRIKWLSACVELLAKALDEYPSETTLHVDFAEEIGTAAGSTKASIKAIENRGRCTFADIEGLLAEGKKDRSALLNEYRSKLKEARSEAAGFRKTLKDLEARQEDDLQAMTETFCIPTEDDMQRIQAFEAHVSRSLARSVEAFRTLRELKREADPVRPRIAVASIAKKAENGKSVQT